MKRRDLVKAYRERLRTIGMKSRTEIEAKAVEEYTMMLAKKERIRIKTKLIDKLRKSSEREARRLANGKYRQFSHSARVKILKRDNFECKSCHTSLTIETMCADHIVPWARGGKTTLKNGQTLCWGCNQSKGAKLPSEIIPLIPYYLITNLP